MSSMEIQHHDIEVFAEDRVNLPVVDAQRHRDQVNGLRKRLETKIDADPNYGLVKMLHAGSVAKGTALRTVNDLDVAVYVNVSEAPDTDPDLVLWLADRLAEANPSMGRDQFEEKDHCVTVNFKGSGLNVDVVPVLYEGDPDDRGYLVRKLTGERVLTSIPLHLDFIRSRKKKYGPDFAQLIRLSKWWKRMVANADADFQFKSFMIELLWAQLADDGLALGDYPSALERFLTYIVKTDLAQQIAFTDYISARDIPARGTDAIEVLDPVNPDNNVAVRYDERDRARIVDAAQDALSALGDARFATTKERALDDWRSVLGPAFGG